MIYNFKSNKKLFDKLSKTYCELIDQTRMSDLDYKPLLEIWDKISIMEVCPDHVLEGLREKRKLFLIAEAIDNQTYKIAMTVSDYNAGKSVADLDIKDWSYGHPRNLRSESTW